MKPIKNLNLKTDGIAIYSNFFSSKELSDLEKESTKIVNLSKIKKWKHIRIYHDYLRFFSPNIFGVDYPFNQKLSNTIYKYFNKLKYKEKILNDTGWKDLITSVVRIHTNSKFYNYQGNWHRDDKDYPSPSSVQIIIYMKDEDGFRIVPKNKNHELSKYGFSIDSNESEFDSRYSNLNRNMYHTINAKKGDIVVFESGLLHQGRCSKERLHLHIRHEKNDFEINNENNYYNIIDNLLPNFNTDEIEINHRYLENNLLLFLKRLLSTISYFIPRFKIIKKNMMGSRKQSITYSTIWQNLFN